MKGHLIQSTLEQGSWEHDLKVRCPQGLGLDPLRPGTSFSRSLSPLDEHRTGELLRGILGVLCFLSTCLPSFWGFPKLHTLQLTAWGPSAWETVVVYGYKLVIGSLPRTREALGVRDGGWHRESISSSSLSSKSRDARLPHILMPGGKESGDRHIPLPSPTPRASQKQGFLAVCVHFIKRIH